MNDILNLEYIKFVLALNTGFFCIWKLYKMTNYLYYFN